MSDSEDRAHLNWYQLSDLLDTAVAEVNRLTVERDEARADVVRLGKALQKAADDQCGCLGTVVP